MRHLLLILVLWSAIGGLRAQTLDVDRQLAYCSRQVKRALAELCKPSGRYDFSQQPRNILHGDR